MTMTAIKYSFDRTFDDDAVSMAAAEAADRAAQIDGARQLGYAEGFNEGEAQAIASLDAQIALSHANIEAQLTTLVSALNATQRALLADASRCVAMLAEAIAGEALLQLPVERIEGVVAPILAELLETPRLVLRIAPDMLDPVKERLEDVAIALGFNGKLIFIAEDHLQSGDVQIEWAHGGLDARIEETRQKVRLAVNGFMQSTTSGQLPFQMKTAKRNNQS